jgi:protease-4
MSAKNSTSHFARPNGAGHRFNRVLAGRATEVFWFAGLVLGVAATSAMAASTESPASEKPRNVVAVFRLEGSLTEEPGDDAFELFSPGGTSLNELVTRLRKAAADSQVKAVVILPESLPGSAQVEELRAALEVIRQKGKEVYVHADSLMLGQFVLACGASRISVVPTGDVMIPGIVGDSLHIRGLLDKLGVKPDFITEGAYKSAAELFMREQPSPQADEMMNWLIDSSFASLKEFIAQGRKTDAAKVQAWIDSGLFSAEAAKSAGLIDAVEQRHELEAMLKEKYGEDVLFEKKYGRKKQDEVDFSSPFAFLKIWSQLFRGPEKKGEGKPAIGIVYVSGPIMTGTGSASPFGGSLGAFSTDISEALNKAAADNNIRAVVLRIDSPGGSATASEIILDATKQLKAKKPLVVSMGDVAGSGGYYVACGAETIFADATTLTGSIGVLGGKLATTEMWKKIGITFKEYKRGQNAGLLSTDDVFSESERAQMKRFMDDAYAVFKKHVTDIRGSRLKKPIDDLAGGRVYTGKQALDLGLVDRLGTLSDAVEFAASEAKIKEYDVRVVPEPKNFLEQLMEGVSHSKNEPNHVRLAPNESSLVKLAAPYLQNLDPRRTAAVVSALTRLEILQKEGVALTMPQLAPVQ